MGVWYVFGFLPVIIVVFDWVSYLCSMWWRWTGKDELKTSCSFMNWALEKLSDKDIINVYYTGDAEDYWTMFVLVFGCLGGGITGITTTIVYAHREHIIPILVCGGLFFALTIGTRVLRTMWRSIKQLAKVAHTHKDKGLMDSVSVDLKLLTEEERVYWEDIKAKAKK